MGHLRQLIKNQLPEYWVDTLENNGAMEPLLNNIVKKFFGDPTVSCGKKVNNFKRAISKRSLREIIDFRNTPEGLYYWEMIEKKLFNSRL
jgi:hypothetical protein